MNNEIISYFIPKAKKVEEKQKPGMIMTIIGMLMGFIPFCIYLSKRELSPLAFLFILAGVPVFIIGISFVKKTVPYYMPGQEYDNIVYQILNKKTSDPKTYVGLDSSEVEEIEPVSFEGYKFVGAGKLRKDDVDGIWRSDLYEKVIIFFTLNEIYVYKVFLNTLTEKVTEATDVLFYEDVVSVSTKNETEKCGNDNIEYVSFNLVSKGGNNLSIALKGSDNSQRSINAMRAMIKEKKNR